MMLFAFFLVFLGAILILWGNFKQTKTEEISEKTKTKAGRKKNLPIKKEKQIRIIQKKIFNKKYPERNLLPEEESAILKEREISTLPYKKREEPAPESLQEENSLEIDPQPVINFLEQEREEKKIHYCVEGILYVDFSREIPQVDKNLKDMDWEESDFTHFRRLGNTQLFQKGNTFEFVRNTILYSINLEEIERIIFFNKAFCILPKPGDIPHLFFFSSELETVKEGISSEYKRM